MANISNVSDNRTAIKVDQPHKHPLNLLGYYQLTKPTIMLLVLITGATALVLEGTLLHQPIKFLLVMVGLYLTGGCANALNQYFEREVDSLMTRTRLKRPLPSGRIQPAAALGFSIAIGVVGVLLFGFVFNWLTAALSLATILFYSLFYTLWLKPNTHQNIVIGGIAGAMAPVGAWTAATGTMAWAPWTIFLIVFLWTPPHFWSLALFCKDDYRLVGYPMLPNVKGDDATYRQILLYSIALVLSSLTPILTGSAWIYAAAASVLGFLFMMKALDAFRNRELSRVRGLFGFSIVYLFGLCFALMLDAVIL